MPPKSAKLTVPPVKTNASAKRGGEGEDGGDSKRPRSDGTAAAAASSSSALASPTISPIPATPNTMKKEVMNQGR